jgi:hypothetical protein
MAHMIRKLNGTHGKTRRLMNDCETWLFKKFYHFNNLIPWIK